MEESSGSSPKEELLNDESSHNVFCRETPSKDLPFKDLFPDEALPEDLSFEFEDVFAKGSLAEDPSLETIHQDLSSENSSTEGDKSSLQTFHTSSEENLVSGEKDSELPDIRRDIVKSLRSVTQWCDDMANTQNDIVTNFKSQLPFIIGLIVVILLLWALKFIYG